MWLSKALFFQCLNLIKDFGSCGIWTYNNGDLERPLSNIRACLLNAYYKLYVHILGPKKFGVCDTLKAKLKKGEKQGDEENPEFSIWETLGTRIH